MKIKNLAVTTLALGAALFASNSNAADAVADASATVIAPITIVKAFDLVFGSFAPGLGGDLTVSTSGARSTTGPVLSTVTATPVSAARFNVTGGVGATYSIDITPSATISDASNSMALAIFSNLTGTDATTGDVTELGGSLVDGTQSIYVGGTLTVAAGQVAGNYAGTIAVEIQYN